MIILVVGWGGRSKLWLMLRFLARRIGPWQSIMVFVSLAQWVRFVPWSSIKQFADRWWIWCCGYGSKTQQNVYGRLTKNYAQTILIYRRPTDDLNDEISISVSGQSRPSQGFIFGSCCLFFAGQIEDQHPGGGIFTGEVELFFST